MESNLESVIDRIAKLEEKIENGNFTLAPPENIVGQQTTEPGVSPAETVPLPKAIPEEVKQVVENWYSIIGNASGMVQSFLRNTKLSIAGDNRLLIVFKDEIAYDFVTRENHKAELQKMICDAIGKDIQVELNLLKEGNRFEDNYPDITQLIQMEVTIEDDDKEEF